MRELDARAALVEAAQRLDQLGLNHNASGNLGVRVDDGILVTPTAVPAAALDAGDLVLLDHTGRPVHEGQLEPTSEWRLHLAVLRRRRDVRAVVHTHSPEATAAATIARSVPAVHYVVARFGGTELPCAPYATFGTQRLAEVVVETLGDHHLACLMANHGAIATGRDLDGALALAIDVEWLCGVHRRAIQQGNPQVLDADEIARVADAFSRYGPPRSR